MQLPIEKLKEVEYYEVKTGIQESVGTYVDRVVLHYGEYEKEYKLFGLFTIFTKTVPDRTEVFEFNRIQQMEDNGECSFKRSEPFRKLYRQLENYFSAKRAEYLIGQLKHHESEYFKKTM